MMSNELKYYVSGSFNGSFSTTEEITLFQNSNDNSKLKVKIYKGIITNSAVVTKKEFDNKDVSNKFSNVNNVQINTSKNWPVNNNRIFSLGDLKLSKIEYYNIHTVDDITVGEVKGEAIASVYEGKFTDIELSKKPPIEQQDWERNQNNSQENQFNTNDENTKLERDQSNTTTSNNKSGCFDFNWKTPWLKWLWYLLALLLLLYLLDRCTKLTQKLKCKFDNYIIEKEEKEIIQNIRLLEDKIRLTEFKISTCGSSLEMSGEADPWKDYFDLGSESGIVEIDYNMYDVADRLEVIYDGNLVDYTHDQIMQDVEGEFDKDQLIKLGFAQGEGKLNRFYFRYDTLKPTEIMLRVLPNKEVNTTRWDVKLNCPR